MSTKYTVLVEEKKDATKVEAGEFFVDASRRMEDLVITVESDVENHVLQGTRKVLDESDFDEDDIHRAHVIESANEYMMIHSAEGDGLEQALGVINPQDGG